MNMELVNQDGKIWGGWGSLQYDTSKELFDILLHSNFLTILNTTKFKFKRIRRFEEAIENFKDELRQVRFDSTIQETNDRETQLTQLKTINDCFKLLKEDSWDLWSAAPFIFECFIEGSEFDLTHLIGLIEKPQGLPLINQMIQDNEADATGFYCWVLYMFFNVHEESFTDFDT